MSEIKELENVPEISFIEHMSLQETEELLRQTYLLVCRQVTGKTPVLGEADEASLILKACTMVLYQVMQYVETKGRAEMLKTSTGEALDQLGTLFGVTRQVATRARVRLCFTLSAPREEVTAIPMGTRVKSQDGRYFATEDYAQIPAGENSVEVTALAQDAGADSNGLAAGAVDTLVDPIPYVKSVVNVEESAGGADSEDDDSLTLRVFLAPSNSSTGTVEAYEYRVREWSSQVEDVEIYSPDPSIVEVLVVMEGGRQPTSAERESLEEYLRPDDRRPLGDRVEVVEAEEVEYDIGLTYFIAESDRKNAGNIEKQVATAVEEYQQWQRKLGRDLNPTELIARVRNAGAKRVKVTAPEDRVVSKKQLPHAANVAVRYGGLEDD